MSSEAGMETTLLRRKYDGECNPHANTMGRNKRIMKRKALGFGSHKRE